MSQSTAAAQATWDPAPRRRRAGSRAARGAAGDETCAMSEDFLPAGRIRPRAVFFDLDGTLVDSAPDLVAAVAALCAELGAPAPDAQAVRQVVSAGGRAMLRQGLPGADDAMIDQWLPRFLDLYSVAMTVHTRLYDGVAEVLARLEDRDIPWGIVTNKPGWLARPLLQQIEIGTRCAALVSGDCLPVKKPDPAPVPARLRAGRGRSRQHLRRRRSARRAGRAGGRDAHDRRRLGLSRRRRPARVGRRSGRRDADRACSRRSRSVERWTRAARRLASFEGEMDGGASGVRAGAEVRRAAAS